MWPQLTDINEDIFKNLTEGSKYGLQASQRIAWIRAFSGAVIAAKGKEETTDPKTGKVETKEITVDRYGLILSSVTSGDVFRAAGQLKASVYGNSVSSGDIGKTWDLKVVPSTSAGGALRPSPTITGFEVKEGKDQISREATLKLKCFSLEQMEYMQTYFLEPGYSLCVEWGWNSVAGASNMIPTDGGAGNILGEAISRNLDYDNLTKCRVDSKGDYDSFLGFIVGGHASSDGDKWDVEVKLRGAPGLPTFLQTQNKTLEIDEKGNVVAELAEPKTFGVSETEEPGVDDIRRDRRFKNMFNQLPAQRQTQAVKDLMETCSWSDFLNFDAVVNKGITTYASPGWWARTFKDAKNIKVGTSTIEKEKLFSKNRYIRFGFAIDILNANSKFTAYKMGNKRLYVTYDIDDVKIGAFPNMFSTKSSKLVIPGSVPDFSAYFLNEGGVDQLANGALRSASGTLDPIDNSIDSTISFVQSTALEYAKGGHKEKKNYWGYLKNLYINFDVFVEKIQQKNKNVREVFLDMLNEMSSAVNSFWNFQINEQKKDNKIILTVYDENWVGQTVTGNRKFYHSGPSSIFLSSDLDISIPADMTNAIISRRLSLANNPDTPIVGVGGFFSSAKDLFLDGATDSKGNSKKQTQKEKDEEKVNKELERIASIPSNKTQKEIDDNEAAITANSLEYAKILAEIDRLDSIEVFNNATNQAAIDKLQKDIDDRIKPKGKELDNKKDELKDRKFEEVKKEEADKVTNAQTALSNNLSKIDVLPQPSEGEAKIDAISAIEDPTGLKAFFVIYCLDDVAFFDRMKNDAFAQKGEVSLSHPLPIKYNFKVLGTSGIRRGDTFNIIGIPTKYSNHGFFQVTNVQHSVEGMSWTTEITGEYRQIQ
jgi:hypothetical protein